MTMSANFGSILFIGLPDITWAFKAKYVKQCEHFNLEVRKVRIIPNLLCAAAKFEMTLIITSSPSISTG